MRHNWLASLSNYKIVLLCLRHLVLLIEFFPLALSVIFFACVCEVQLHFAMFKFFFQLNFFNNKNFHMLLKWPILLCFSLYPCKLNQIGIETFLGVNN